MITKEKKIESIIKRAKVIMAVMALFCLVYPICGQAEQIHFDTKIAELKLKFPEGKYWNHVGMTTDNSDGYTDQPCSLHKTSGVSHVNGTGGCTCNRFAGGGHLLATQCMGFANKLGYDVFGDTVWTMNPSSSPVTDIRVGDIVRLDYNGHSVFVIARNENVITVAEANYSGPCQISWTRTIDLSVANITYYERANNYDSVIGNTTSSPEQGSTENNNPGGNTTEKPATQPENPGEETTESPVTEPETGDGKDSYSGWKLADDGLHYQYYESGKIQKNTWLTIKKNTYYLDENGYRVSGFYDVKQHPYYFNSKGVMQKKKWFEVDGEIFYVNEDGLVLKSQWLWYNNNYVYVTVDGSIAKNELVKIGSETYYFDSNGTRSKGFKNCNGKYYYCDSKGIIQKKKWITQNGKKYYLQKSGVRAQSKLLTIGNYKYYFNSKGHMVKNKQFTYKGKVYKADKKGHCKFVKNAVAS